jgi:endonuclease/exonuclease/phosphatase family metal-dependent hydrolase
MPIYTGINDLSDAGTRRRIADGLLRLKDGLRAQGVPDRALDSRLLLATWNVREFDSTKGGVRSLEPLLYIAEIISAFDIVAVQEIREDLRPLDRLLGLLGRWWRFVLTDVTRGSSGNLERLAFLYDERKVRFSGLAGEVVLPSKRSRSTEEFRRQFARTPFLVGFSVGWFKFTICTAHMYYGDKRAVEPRRLEEITNLAQFLADQRTEIHDWANNVIMLGDFNIFATTDATAVAIENAGFILPDKLKRVKSNLGGDKHYDQIAFRTPDVANQFTEARAGVFPFHEYVYRSSDEREYDGVRRASAIESKTRELVYRTWRTYQMSDHLPLWAELKTDFSTKYLRSWATSDRVGAAAAKKTQEQFTQMTPRLV